MHHNNIESFIYFQLSFYDERGLKISSLGRSSKHYVSRGFLCDVIGCMPWPDIINLFLTKPITKNEEMLINTFTKYAHLYLLIGYFNYLADMPNVNFPVLMVCIFLRSKFIKHLTIVYISPFWKSQLPFAKKGMPYRLWLTGGTN